MLPRPLLRGLPALDPSIHLVRLEFPLSSYLLRRHILGLDPLEHGISADTQISADLLEGIPSVGDLHANPPTREYTVTVL